MKETKNPPSLTNTGLKEQLLADALEKYDLQVVEKINELEEIILSKNRQLCSVHSELQTLYGITANDYQQTLKHIYTALEHIITSDARHFSDTSKGCLRRAQSAIQKMQLLTNDIVDFSRIGTGDTQLELVDLDALLGQVLNEMSGKIAACSATIETTKLPAINGYPLLLSLLFYHLIDNAVKFCEQHDPPEVSILYDVVPAGNISIHGMQSGYYHQVSFIDKGIGFPQEESGNIFSMLYRLHERKRYRGSGIGLAVCRKIMTLHNGFIIAESTPYQGASFMCFFPME